MALSSPDEREAALYERLRRLGIAWTTQAHTPVFTVEEAMALYDSQPGGHTKNLFLKDKKDGLWLVTLRDHLRVDMGALAKRLGAPRFSFGSAELLIKTLGIEPGSVTPFAVMNDTAGTVRLVLDEGMLALDPLNFHPLRNDRTTAVSADALLRFVRDTGHEPVIVEIPERPTSAVLI
ncbi:MAG: prolyl-tRNA synthetase associated domain-containing protein [Alphaproteobacteria bacterium]|nr:prolyl-tRNA synthetase associated domain-containing protein [Alphaproteobacteria bacterium]MBL7096246.1 prolyl-tRNA synthetase associated domain-containing protein [Alphaproteobacteria bacterium]